MARRFRLGTMHGSGSDDGLASGLDDARTNEEAKQFTERLLHPPDRRGTWLAAALSTGRGDEMLELVFE